MAGGGQTPSSLFRQMRALGFDNLRLPVSWSLLEPTPGQLDRTYLERIAQVVGWAKAQGIWVVIDLHQDAWSKYDYTPDGQPCPPGTGTVKDQDGAPPLPDQVVRGGHER